MYRPESGPTGLLPHGALPDAARQPPPARDDDVGDLVVRGITKAFTPGSPVLQDVSFAIPAGQSVALIGSNGAGKSTLLRCCMNLIEPDSGSVYLFGQPLQAQSTASLRHLRSQVGFVFQKHNLVPRLSALTNVLQGALARAPFGHAWFQGTAPRALREEAMHCLERVGLADKARHRADQLSGGQSQRVAVGDTLKQCIGAIRLDATLGGKDVLVDRVANDLALTADPVRLAQILNNLIANAFKYGDNSSPIRVSARAGRRVRPHRNRQQRSRHSQRRARGGVPALPPRGGRCLLYTSPSPRDVEESRMPSSA